MAFLFEAGILKPTTFRVLLMLTLKKMNSQIAAPSCTLLVSHANFYLHKNPTIEIGSKGLKGSKTYDFICAVIRFAILLIFLETVWSYFLDIFFKR